VDPAVVRPPEVDRPPGRLAVDPAVVRPPEVDRPPGRLAVEPAACLDVDALWLRTRASPPMRRSPSEPNLDRPTSTVQASTSTVPSLNLNRQALNLDSRLRHWLSHDLYAEFTAR